MGETVSASRQWLQRRAQWFRHRFASAASVTACMAQMQSLLQQQWALRAGPGEPAISVAVGQLVDLLLVMLRPPPDPVPCHVYVLVGLFNVCWVWPAYCMVTVRR